MRRNRAPFKYHESSPYILPRQDFLILPELPSCTSDISQRQQDRRLRSFINRLDSPSPRHIRDHIARTATIDQDTPIRMFRLLLGRNSPRSADKPALAHRIGLVVRPALLGVGAILDGSVEGIHHLRHIRHRARGEELLSYCRRVLACQVACHACNIDEAAAGTEKRKEGLRGEDCAVIVALQGRFHNFGVCHDGCQCTAGCKLVKD